MKRFILIFYFFGQFISLAQQPFLYDVVITPVEIPNLPGLHSYAFGSSDSLHVFIGGRRDGLHARQPFNAFPESYNNDSIFVVDIKNQQCWSKSLDGIATTIAEQLQASNMVFYQDEDTLILIGGYAYSNASLGHITFPSMVTVEINALIDSIIHDNSIVDLFKQKSDSFFAVTGGQLGKIDNTFLLVGGHRFDGAYNPMNNPTYVQTYTNAIRKFEINNSTPTLSTYNHSELFDVQHLHRRDYNLMPYLYTNGDFGYLLSSGVFQTGVDLPFLYPVEISANAIQPITTFNQKLSNYHSAKVSLYDSLQSQMSMLFFGGMASYYYNGSTLVYDDKVPFVNTVSLLIQSNSGSLHEYKVSAEMPQLQGSSAEFIPLFSPQLSNNGIIYLPQIPQDSIVIGHIFGGIYSPTLNPFAANQTTTTAASNVMYKVTLVYNPSLSLIEVPNDSVNGLVVYPNPIKNKFYVEYDLKDYKNTRYVIASVNGEIVQEGYMENQQAGINIAEIKLERNINAGTYILTLIFDETSIATHKIVVE